MIGWGLGLNIAAANVPVSLCFSGLTALGRAGCPQPAVDQIENRISHEVRSPIRERTARRAVPTSEGGAFEGRRGHGDMGTRGVNEDLRTRGLNWLGNYPLSFVIDSVIRHLPSALHAVH